MQKIKKAVGSVGRRIDFNAPVILWMAMIAFVMVPLNAITSGLIARWFAVYYTSFMDIAMYPRLFTHVLVHVDLAHYTANFLTILIIGPLVEEKYGSLRLLLMILVTAGVTGLFHVLFSRSSMLMGASGIVFMLILLASFVNLKQGKIPLTVLLVGILYLGNEILTGVTSYDSVSHISHILGGLCGGIFGTLLGEKKPKSA